MLHIMRSGLMRRWCYRISEYYYTPGRHLVLVSFEQTVQYAGSPGVGSEA